MRKQKSKIVNKKQSHLLKIGLNRLRLLYFENS